MPSNVPPPSIHTQMPKAGVGVLVDNRVSAEKPPIPGAADLEVTHSDRDVVECGEGHGLTLTLDDAAALSCARSHVPQVELIAEDPRPVRNQAVGQPQGGQ